MLPSNLPFRIGTTSYIIPDDILPNVKFLAGKVQDVQLVLFELDNTQNNLPDAKQVAELRTIASQADLTYTVHLPLDLRLAANGEEIHISLQKAKRVIEATRDLSPRAYIVHLDGKEERNSTNTTCIHQWQQHAVESLKVVASHTRDIRLLAVENLEGYPITFNDEVIRISGCSRCIDIGHLWLDGHDPASFFPGRIGQASVMHIHGIEERDHKSLIHIAPKNLDSVFRGLLDSHFGGVLTIEVFSQEDLETSMQAISASFERIRGK
jgi:sugar phosphate isomerase/epimerase